MNSLPLIKIWIGFFIEPKPERESRVLVVTAKCKSGPFTMVLCARGKNGRVWYTFGRN